MQADGRSVFRVDGETDERYVEWHIDTDPIVMHIRFGHVILDTADPTMRTCLEALLTAMSDQRYDPALKISGH